MQNKTYTVTTVDPANPFARPTVVGRATLESPRQLRILVGLSVFIAAAHDEAFTQRGENNVVGDVFRTEGRGDARTVSLDDTGILTAEGDGALRAKFGEDDALTLILTPTPTRSPPPTQPQRPLVRRHPSHPSNAHLSVW